VSPGVHVMPNDRLDSSDFWKVARAKAWLRDAEQLDWETLRATLQNMLADGSLPGLENVPGPAPEAPFDPAMLQRLSALCVRTQHYGTRSSTVVALAEQRVVEYWSTDGPPDQANFVDLMGLF
jgi:uncharacterized protein with NRDE domain